jgi:conjugal transfer/type IV secretion protein DotA/TraY
MKISFQNSIKWLSLAATAAVMLLPSLAFAQAGSPFVLPEDDLSRRTFIEPLFGPLVGGGDSPLTTLMASFNAALLVFGGILMAYTIVAGTMSTAHDGEMLGKKWSSMWLPIRTALGVGMVLPVVGGGWCVAQAIVVWLAMQGAALANTLWGSFIGPDLSSVATAATYNPPSSLTAVRDTYAAMLINSTCVAAFQKENGSSGADATLFNNPDYSIIVTPSLSAVPTPDNNKLTIEYASNGVIGTLFDARCGKIVVAEDLDDSGMMDPLTNGNNSASTSLLSMRDVATPVAEARWVEFQRATRRMADLGNRIAQMSPTDAQAGTLQDEVNRTFDELLQSYSTNVNAAAKTAFTGAIQTDFIDKIKADGWIMAGAFYMQMSKTQDLVTRSVTNAPVTAGPNYMQTQGGGTAGAISQTMSSWMVGGTDQIEASVAMAQKMANRSAAAGGSLSMIGRETGERTGSDSAWASRLVNWFVNSDETGLFSGGRTEMVDVNENPIIMAKGLGEKMTVAAWSSFAAFAGFTLGGTGGLGTTIAPVFSALFLALLIPGATLSTYLPMLPYILWLGVVLGWAILLIEAVVAAPLWAIVHLAPDGDGVVGRGGQGYMLVLSLVLRPPLMIIGLVAAFVLMKPIGFLVNSTFVGAFDMGVSPGFFGITQAIAGCIIYAVLMMIIVQRVFSLIHVIPDRLLRWIGGGGGELGQEAGALDQGSNAKLAAALGIGNQMGNSMMAAATNAKRDALADKDRKTHAARQASISQDQAIESAAGNYADRDQDANYASDKASAARGADGRGDESLEGGAAIAHGKAARAAEHSAASQAGRDDTPEGVAFRGGLENARAAEAGGKAGAVNDYMDAQTLAAQDKSANGGSLRPFQESLLARGAHKAQQAEHQSAGDSVRGAKRDAAQRQELAAQHTSMAQQETGKGRAAAASAVSQAAGSSHPDARAFTESVAEARASGQPGATTAAVNNATEAAYEAQRNGSTQPFQQSLIDRDQHNQAAERHQEAASRALNPQTSTPQPTMPEDPFADSNDMDGAPPGGAR